MSKPSSLDRAAGDLDAGHPTASPGEAGGLSPLGERSNPEPLAPSPFDAPSPFAGSPPSPFGGGSGAPLPFAGELPSPFEAAAPGAPRVRTPSYFFLAAVSLVTLAADLGTKSWAENNLQGPGQVPMPKTVIKGLFGFMLAHNKGGAWGLLQGSAENFRKYFFLVVSVMAILFIVSLYRRLHPAQHALRWGLPLVLGGALGNLVDRVRYKWVVDFIDCQVTWSGTAHHWPTFNVADIAICVGVGLMAIDMLSGRKHDAPRPALLSLGAGAELPGTDAPPPASPP